MEPYPQQTETLRLIVRLAVAVMAADGQITPVELEAIRGLERLGIGSVDGTVREEIERAMVRPIDLGEACEQLAYAAPQAKAAILLAVIDVALADHEVSPPELATLRRSAAGLRLPPAVAEQLLGRFYATDSASEASSAPVPEPARPVQQQRGDVPASASAGAPPVAPSDPLRAFGLPPPATREELDRAYLALVDQYDPAKLASLGPDFVALAVTKLAAVTRSFEAARRALAGENRVLG